jgi:hypothetical protein
VQGGGEVKRISIAAAKRIADDYDCPEVVISGKE